MTADGRFLFYQIHFKACIRQVQAGLHPCNTSSYNHHCADWFTIVRSQCGDFVFGDDHAGTP